MRWEFLARQLVPPVDFFVCATCSHLKINLRISVFDPGRVQLAGDGGWLQWLIVSSGCGLNFKILMVLGGNWIAAATWLLFRAFTGCRMNYGQSESTGEATMMGMLLFL